MGDYSPALVSDSVAFYHNRLSGFLGRYVSTQREKTYVEMAIDWEGMYSEESREMFRIPRPDATRSTADSISDTPSRCSTSPARNSTRT